MQRARYRRTQGKRRHDSRAGMTCMECGKAFEAKRSDARYCSRVCAKTAYYRDNRERMLEKGREWARTHPEQVREIAQRSARKNAERIRAQKRAKYDAISADPEKAAERHRRRLEYYAANRDHALELERQRRLRDPFAARYYKHGGVDWQTLFQGLWDAQEGRCYLCGDALQPDAYRAVHLDHDHTCCPLGRSCAICRRGLACKYCNTLIGHARDDPGRLRRIADNLERANAGVRDRRAAAPPPELPLEFPRRTERPKNPRRSA